MAQKQYGIIPHDTTQVGYGQDEPVVDHEAMKAAMVDKIKKNRKKKKPKSELAKSESAIEERRRREREELHGTGK